MRQLVARIDDNLHRRLKERAAREGRPLNDLVTEVLAAAVDDEAASFRRRLDRSGLRVLPQASPVPVPRAHPDREDDHLDGEDPRAGDAVLEALLAERDAR